MSEHPRSGLDPRSGLGPQSGLDPQSGFELANTVIGAPFARDLALFYAELLGWSVGVDSDDGDWIILRNPDGGPGLSFQSEEGFEAPMWPPAEGRQQMMMHLDIGVTGGPSELETATARAVELGARPAAHQPQRQVRVLIDPVGHPFCLFPLGEG